MQDDWTTHQERHGDSAGTQEPAGLNPATQEHSADGHSAVRRAGAAGGTSTSWRIEVMVDDSGEWESDPFRFQTWHEALAYARDLELRWAAVRDRRVVRSEEPVNYSWPQSGERAGADSGA
jgi:hypothetical protein